MFKSALFALQPLIAIANPTDPFVAIAEQASRSVVFVATESNPFDLSYGEEPGYYEYLRPFSDFFWPSEYVHGSGFIISPDGYIVTNAHVVRDATKVMIVMRLNEMQLYEASVLGRDWRSDIAVLKIEDDTENSFPVLQFGDSNQIQVGESVICIGNPLGPQLESSVTTGIVSGIDRNHVGLDSIEGYIQTDAVVNSGNSGGPLLNTQGEVIGVVSSSLRNKGISFAISSYVAEHITKQIIANGKVSQGFLGIELDVDDDTETAFDVYYFDRNRGAHIKTVVADSPAEKADLRSGDLILKVDQQLIRSAESLRNQIAILEPNANVQLTLDRQGTILEVIVELGDEELSDTYSHLEGPFIVI